MNWGQWTLIGLAIALAITAIILSSISLTTNPSTTSVSVAGMGVADANLVATHKIDGQRYFYKTITPDSQPLENDLILEDVGNVNLLRRDGDPQPGQNIAIVSAPGAHNAQPFPLEILEDHNQLTLQSTEPTTIRVNQFQLGSHVVAPANISTTGEKGQKGDTGFKGCVGAEGPKGCPCLCISAKGNDGQKGERGNQGPSGEDNNTDGKDGGKGQKGEVGIEGIQGLPGPIYVFSKYWDLDDDRKDDEATDPRPADFPKNGEYGLVNETGKVYLSDGKNLTEVDDISTQLIRGEQGEKGEKGSEKGMKGCKGATGHSCLEKGDIGPQGYQGPNGTEKGEKGNPNLNVTNGDTGDRGENGETGPQGTPGAFSTDGFEEVTQSTLVVTKGTDPSLYILTVYNPVYSVPVTLWAWGRSTLDPVPSWLEVKENGTSIEVEVDSLRHGNANYTNPAPRVYFVWHNNTSISDVITIDPNPSLSVGGSVTGLVEKGQVNLGLFIDNDSTPREIVTILPAEQKTFQFGSLLNEGQQYEVVITNTDIPSCELMNRVGIMGTESVDDVVLECKDVLGTPTIVQYIQVNRDASNVRVSGRFSSQANSANVYIDGTLDTRVSMKQDPETFDWSFETSFPIATFDLQVELLQNGRPVSNISLPFVVILTIDLPPSIRRVTSTADYDIVEGDLTTAADTLEFFSDLGVEFLLPGTTVEFSSSQWLARVPPQVPRGIQQIFCRARVGQYRTSYSWGFQYDNSLDS